VPVRFLTQADHSGRPAPPGRGSRLLLLVLAGSLWAGAVVGRLVYLAVIRHKTYQAMALRQQQRVIEISPERGTISDRSGSVLAVSLPVQSCFAVPPEIKDKRLASRLLAKILEMPAKDIETRLKTDRSFVWVARRLPPEVVERISRMNLKGIYFEKEMERFYPKRQLAAQVLGFVDIDGHGQAGVEYRFDKEISGRPGELFVLADGKRRYYHRNERPAVPGANVQLTIDENIQYIAEKELEAAVKQEHALRGSVIVMKPTTGEVLAMANYPTFNPNLPAESTSGERQNHAISDIYEPGSTFKTITLSAAVDDGLVTPGEVFDCQMGSIRVAGRLIHDWHRFGLLTVSQVLMNSSDVGAIKIALKLGDDNLYHYMRAFGFGQKTGIRLPWESPGLLRPPKLWTASSIGSLAMGQEVGVTTLQLTDAVSAIANGGLLFRPRIISQIDQNGQVIIPPEPPPTRAISPMTAATMRHMMEGVVLEGTGRKARLDGYTTAGKTGTAQKIDPQTHSYSHTHFVASFIGFAPVNNPAVVTLVVVDDPQTLPLYKREGGWAAAPVFKRVMEQVLNYLGVPHDLPLQPPAGSSGVIRASLGAPARPIPGAGRTTATRPRRPAGMNSTAAAIAGAGTTMASTAPTQPPPGMLVMPSLVGKTVRAATQQCLRMGLNPTLEGTGLAVEQNPEAGSFVRAGARVRVRFALRPKLVPTKARDGNAP
jgi:cell division protein FtsI/penicillin-binding protein 2